MTFRSALRVIEDGAARLMPSAVRESEPAPAPEPRPELVGVLQACRSLGLDAGVASGEIMRLYSVQPWPCELLAAGFTEG